MIHNIEAAGAGKFLHNGIVYPRKFIPELVGERIRLFNVYDGRVVRFDFTHYSDILIDGVAQSTPTDTQALLLSYCYTPGGNGGGGGDQDLQSVLNNGNSATEDIEIYNNDDENVIISPDGIELSKAGQTEHLNVNYAGLSKRVLNDSRQVVNIDSSYNIKLPQTNDGIATKLLGTDASGNVVKVNTSTEMDTLGTVVNRGNEATRSMFVKEASGSNTEFGHGVLTYRTPTSLAFPIMRWDGKITIPAINNSAPDPANKIYMVTCANNGELSKFLKPFEYLSYTFTTYTALNTDNWYIANNVLQRQLNSDSTTQDLKAALSLNASGCNVFIAPFKCKITHIGWTTRAASVSKFGIVKGQNSTDNTMVNSDIVFEAPFNTTGKNHIEYDNPVSTVINKGDQVRISFRHNQTGNANSNDTVTITLVKLYD